MKLDQYIAICSQYGHTMCLLEVTQHVVNLLLRHVSPILLVGLSVFETPGVYTIRGISSYTPLAVAPKVAVGISIPCQVLLHVFH